MNIRNLHVSLRRLADAATVIVCVLAIYIVVRGRDRTEPPSDFATQPSASERGPRSLEPELAAMINESGLSRGVSTATVVLTEFGDYECSGCRYYERLVSGLLAEWPTELRVNWRHFPLSYHAGAVPAARAASCADSMGRFAAFHELLFRDQRWKWNPVEAFRTMAAAVGVSDSSAFESCLGDLSETPDIARDLHLASELGLTATPSFVLNGVILRPGVDSSELSSLVSAAIRKAR